MKYLIAACCLILTAFAYAAEPLPANLIDLNTQTGLALFRENLDKNSLKLLNHFTTQKTLTYCGVASAVMVLNATNIARPIDLQHPPYQYFNQENFFNDGVKKVVTAKQVSSHGMTLIELAQAIQNCGLKAKPFFANDLNLQTFRETLKNAISNQQFVIVNFLRTKLGQQGGGHHSPVAAYNYRSDRFLLLDVARYKYPAYWVRTKDLWESVNTMSENTYRGFIIVHQ